MAGLAYRNPAVQRLRHLVEQRRDRSEQRRFVVEGPKLLGEALGSGAHVEAVYLDPGSVDEADRDLVARCESSGATVFPVEHRVLSRVCDATSPRPLAAIVAMIDVPLSSLRGIDPRTAVVAVGLGDPGNAGTVLRSAAASGTGGVVFCAGCVDVYNPKTVRASAGSIFRIPLSVGGEPGEVLDQLSEWGMRIVASVPEGGTIYSEIDLTSPTAVVLGSESSGLPPDIEDVADVRVTIPMDSGVESLNVAMAATILCFEASRQRHARASS